MKKSTLAELGAIIILVVILIVSSVALGRSDPEIQTYQAASSATGSTLPSLTFAGGAAVGKATRTITVSAVPGVPDTITIGTCVVSFLSGDQDSVNDSNCNNNTASVYTLRTDEFFSISTLSEAEVASFLQSLTNVSDTGHGALTVAAPSATTVRFTTTGAETTATEISFTDNTGGDIVSSVSTPGVLTPTAATASLTISDALPAGSLDHSVTIDGVVVNLGSPSSGQPSVARTAAEVASDIAAANFSAGTSYGTGGAYTVAANGSTVTFTRTSTGSAGNGSVTIADATYGAVAQSVVFTPQNLIDGAVYIYKIIINGTTHEYQARNATAKKIVESFNEFLSNDAAVDCTEDDVALTCTASTPGTSFTYDTDVTLVPNTGSSSASPKTSAPKVTTDTTTQSTGAPTTTTQSGAGVSGSGGVTTSAVNGQTNPAQPTQPTQTKSEAVAVEESLPPPPLPSIPFTPVESTFTQNMSSGVTDQVVVNEVSRLQEFLAQNPLFYPEGFVTGYFGEFTRTAVLRFQLTYGIVTSPSDPGAGEFGPKTRALANWLEFYRRTVSERS